MPPKFKEFVDAMFLDHPRSGGETYLQHLCFTVKYGLLLMVASVVFICHGLLPKFNQTTTSETIYRIHDIFRAREKLRKDSQNI